jgi:hypothetical protein
VIRATNMNEALEKARELYNDEQTRVGMTPIHLTEIFPELKESEDERIREALMEMIYDTPGIECEKIYKISKEKCIAWLEKQGEQKPFDYEHANIHQKDFTLIEPKFHVGDWITIKE